MYINNVINFINVRNYVIMLNMYLKVKKAIKVS